MRHEWRSIISYRFIFYCFHSFPVSNVSRPSRKRFSWSTILRLNGHKNHQKDSKESLRHHVEMAISPDCRLVSGEFRGLLSAYVLSAVKLCCRLRNLRGRRKNVSTKKVDYEKARFCWIVLVSWLEVPLMNIFFPREKRKLDYRC